MCVAVVVVSVSNTHNATRLVFQLCTVRFPRGVNSVAYFANRMVEQSMQVTSEYEERLRRCEDVPRFSFGRRMLKNDGDPTRFFLMYLIGYTAVTGLQSFAHPRVCRCCRGFRFKHPQCNTLWLQAVCCSFPA